MKHSRVARALAAAATAALTLATPAAADGLPAAWSAASCATGTMVASPIAGGNLSLTGSIQPCEPSALPPRAMFTVAYYGEASATPGRLIEYASDRAEPTHFARRLDVSRPDFPPEAICLVFSPNADGRLVCFAIGVDDTGRLAATPISTDDPLVARVLSAEVAYPDDPSGNGQHCGTCV